MAKYAKQASAKVERAMKMRSAGTLKSGRSGKTVTSRKQAIAIGLSEARSEGRKVPRDPSNKAGKKTASKKTAGNKTASKKTTRKKSGTTPAISSRTMSKSDSVLLRRPGAILLCASTT